MATCQAKVGAAGKRSTWCLDGVPMHLSTNNRRQKRKFLGVYSSAGNRTYIVGVLERPRLLIAGRLAPCHFPP
jgi:hypothetical protein